MIVLVNLSLLPPNLCSRKLDLIFLMLWIENFTLSPDPTDRLAGSRNDNFVNLVVLKSACLLSMSELRSAANRSIGIRET